MPSRLVVLLCLVALGSCARVVESGDFFLPNPQVLEGDIDGSRMRRVRMNVPEDRDDPDGPTVALHGIEVGDPASPDRILYIPGNAASIATSLPKLIHLTQITGMTVVGFDYRGFGDSEGVPTLRLCSGDLVRIFDVLARELGGRISVYGRSLGGGFACYLAAKRPVSGLVIESGPASIPEVVASWNTAFPWYLRLFWDFSVDEDLAAAEFQPVAHAARIQVRTVVLHGDADRVVPVAQALQLHAAIPHDRKHLFVFPGKGHRGVPLVGDEVLGALRMALSGK